MGANSQGPPASGPCEFITSVKHPALRRARALSAPAGRAAHRQYLVEGEDMLRQALAAGAAILDAFFLGGEVAASLASALAARGGRCYVVSRGLMTRLLGTGYDTSIRAAAIVPMRLSSTADLAAAGGPLLVCERIQDPRNVGVLMRTAEAAGARGMILTADSAQPFSRSAVRSSTGSVLRLALAVTRDLGADLATLRQAGLRLIASSARGTTPIHAAGLGADCAVIVGNETEGISPAVAQLADRVAAIPVAGGASSFNVTVAAGILLYECLRPRES